MTWRQYQYKLGAPARRPHLSVVRRCDLEPVHQPEETTAFTKTQLVGLYGLIGIAVLVLIALAAFAGGAW